MAKKDRGLTPDELERETRKLAQDLAFNARSPVNIQLVGGRHIAFTFNADDEKKQHQIPIVMNPSTLKSVRNKEQAIKIWWGIGIHELLHHLFPASAQYKTAHKEGFGHLFNLIDDEQNERRGRAMNDHWGSYLQAVCAHVFSSKRRLKDTISTGIMDGGKEERKPRGIAASKIYTQRWNQFAFHFRLHVPDPPDPVVAEALALIPRRFKDLTKEELLELARQIHLVFSSGIEMPEAEEKATEDDDDGKENKPEENQPQDRAKDESKDKDEPKDEPEETPLPDVGWGRRLLASKWAKAIFALFVLVWAGILLKGGVNFWVQVAVTTFIIGGSLIAFLFLRRAYIKALLASMKARALPAGPAGTGTAGRRASPLIALPAKLLANKKMRYTLLGITGVAVGYGLFELSRAVALPLFLLMVEVLLIALAVIIGKRVKTKADKDKGEVGKFSTAAIIALALLGLCGMAYTVGTMMGWGWLIIAPLGGLSGMIVAVLIVALLAKAQEKGGRGGYVRESYWTRLRRIVREKVEDIWEGFLRACAKARKKVARFFSWLFGLITRGWGRLMSRVLVPSWLFIARWSKRGYWKVEPWLSRLWRHTMFRLAVVSLPVAALLLMLYAVLFTASKISIWLLIALLILLLILLLLGFLFRKKIKQFVINELLMPMPNLMDLAMKVPLDMETEWFVQVDDVVPVEADQKLLDELLPKVAIFAEQLRPYLKKCGRQPVDRDGEPEGYDLSDDPELVLVGESSIFVNDDIVPKPSVHIEVALDCSSSMNSATVSLKPGEKFALGKFFALVLEQAMVNLPGVSGHLWGFTDRTIYDCGTPGEGRVSGLVCAGGNNDAAMLWHMGQSAAQSGKDVKILLMLSDGQPSECSWLSLHNLVLQFEQEGMIPWNFALDVIQIPAFERFFTDLVGQSMEEAVITMGETLASIAQDGV
ncbi:MAG TPA: hypothetical protein V6D17_17390 [Candidatus Obscuribacterales bacterium]